MYTYTLQISGMTCGGCVATVQRLLLAVRDTVSAEIDLVSATAKMRTVRAIDREEITRAFAGHSKYALVAFEELSEEVVSLPILPILTPSAESVKSMSDTPEHTRSWFNTYKPVLLIFALVGTVSLILGVEQGMFSWMTFLRVFMAGFFLVFSFFKLLDISAFAESYAMYDIVAKRFPVWGKMYPFVELGLGLAFVADIAPVAMNWITLIVMSVSIVGVLQQVLNKRAIRCACLGTVFQLPMSTITIIEDGLMIVMSIGMIILHS